MFCRTVAKCRLSSPTVSIIKKKTTLWVVFFYGDPERTRTVDLQRDRLAC